MSTLWIAWLIKGFIERKSFSIFMSLAFLAIVWNKELGIEAITPWPVMGAAIFLTIGVSFIFKDSKRKIGSISIIISMIITIKKSLMKTIIILKMIITQQMKGTQNMEHHNHTKVMLMVNMFII